MIIEIDKLNTFHILGFAVNNHIIGRVGFINNIKQLAIYLTQQSVGILKPATQGEKIQMSSAHIKWLIKMPA